jgi:DHA1 family tetracycline resistance protein-like MFS transporter
MFKGRGSPLIPLFLIVFINLVGFGIIIPLLPLYAASFNASPTAIGFLLASYSLAQMVATPYLGALSDRYGRRPILLLSQLGTLVSFLLLGFANTLPLVFWMAHRVEVFRLHKRTSAMSSKNVTAPKRSA